MATITKNSQTKTILNVISTLTDIEKTSNKYKGCFFWQSPQKAADRRKQEFNESYDFTVFGDVYNIELDLSISCSSFYFTKNIYFNGNKTTMTKIKNLKKKLVAAVEARELKKASKKDLDIEIA